MKGYFARIASRAIGAAPRAALQPQKGNAWPGTPAGDRRGMSGNHLHMEAWPDRFEQGGIEESASISPRSGAQTTSFQPGVQQAITPPTVEAHAGPLQLHAPALQPQNGVLSQSPATASPITLQPQNASLEFGIGQQPAAKSSKIVPPSEEDALTGLDLLEHIHQSRSATLNPPTPVPHMRIVRMVGSSSGPLDQLMLHELSPGKQEAPPSTPEKAQLQPASMPTPKTAAATLPPETQQYMQRLLASPTLRPQQPAPPTPIAAAYKTAATRPGLSIGKITIEVIEAPKPAVVAQTIVAAATKSAATRTPSHRPESNLKYGLGQL
jgi:hypothetical protein